ncbi:multicopper oxidase domain-containing protein [Tardibacter chloracetimidivorans]|uniref:multicopper oxidase domain-containing protein n=1 Tax=Tardibacter chloracetimidivorans TaxID=1921510 RepID=UPI0009FB59F7
MANPRTANSRSKEAPGGALSRGPAAFTLHAPFHEAAGQGQNLIVDLVNNSSEGTSIHWHGTQRRAAALKRRSTSSHLHHLGCAIFGSKARTLAPPPLRQKRR